MQDATWQAVSNYLAFTQQEVGSPIFLSEKSQAFSEPVILELYQVCQDCSVSELSEVLQELLRVIAQGDIYHASRTALICGSLVEQGASYHEGLPILLERLSSQLLDAWQCYQLVQRKYQLAPAELSSTQVLAIEDLQPGGVKSWKGLAFMIPGALTMLALSVAERRKAREMSRLLQGAFLLGSVHLHAYYLDEMLAMADEEEVVVVDPAQKRGFVVALEGIRNNAHLFTLFQEEMLRRGELPGETSFDIRAVAHGEQFCQEPFAYQARYHFYQWPSLTGEGEIAKNPAKIAPGHSFWDIQLFREQAVVVIEQAHGPADSWDLRLVNPLHSGLRSQIIFKEILSHEQVEHWLERICSVVSGEREEIGMTGRWGEWATSQAEQEMKAAIERGDFPAVYQLCSQVAESELLPVLFSQVASDNSEALLQVPLGEESHFNSLALRAKAYQHQGKRTVALDLLFKVMLYQPTAPYLQWLPSWFGEMISPRLVSFRRIDRFVAKWCLQKFASARLYKTEQQIFRQIAPLIEMLAKVPPVTNFHYGLLSAYYRKLGELEKALPLAEKAYHVSPSAQSRQFLALVHWQAENYELAERLYQEALEESPESLVLRKDLAKLWWEKQNFAQAAELYLEISKRDPQDYMAQCAHHFLMFHHVASEKARKKYQKLAALFPVSLTAGELEEFFIPYVGYLPKPTHKVLEQFQEQQRQATGGKLALTVSSLEAPSCLLALQLQAAKNHQEIQFTFISEEQTPDPSLPRKDVNYCIWDQQGGALLPPPGEEVYQKIAQLAHQPYQLRRWWDDALAIARELGPGKEQEILAVMSHPQQPPSELHAWTWLEHLQLATSLVIARLEESWYGSLRREILVSLVNGPKDWVSEAAATTLTQVALEVPEACSEVAALLEANFHYWAPCISDELTVYAIARNGLRLPNLAGETRGIFSQFVEEWREKYA